MTHYDEQRKKWHEKHENKRKAAPFNSSDGAPHKEIDSYVTQERIKAAKALIDKDLESYDAIESYVKQVRKEKLLNSKIEAIRNYPTMEDLLPSEDMQEFPEFEEAIKQQKATAVANKLELKQKRKCVCKPKANDEVLKDIVKEVDTMEIFHLGIKIPKEMGDFTNVLHHSASKGKYPANNWLEPNGMSCERKSMYASMFRHLAEANCGSIKDKDSGLHPLLHLAARALMAYTRYIRGLKHEKDAT